MCAGERAVRIPCWLACNLKPIARRILNDNISRPAAREHTSLGLAAPAKAHAAALQIAAATKRIRLPPQRTSRSLAALTGHANIALTQIR